MENYSYNSYPESGDSSPRSREIDFENPPPWEDGQNHPLPANYKVKFMCSYGGKIHPRPHDNLLSYIGGETKILAVDRNTKFSPLLSKLVALCDNDNISFKYQLPGEDLDSLISVTNDDDLEHMMHEYDRLYRVSPKPARLRLFVFSNPHGSMNSSRSFGSSEEAKSEKERFVEALNTGPVLTAPPPAASSAVAAPSQPPAPTNTNVDFLFGFEKGNGVAPPQPVTAGKVHEPEDPVVPGLEEKLIGSDPIQKHIQDLQRLRLEEQQGIYRRKNDDNIAGGFTGGEYYKPQEKVSPVTIPGGVQMPPGYWTEKQVAGGVYAASAPNTEQPVYFIPNPASAYHAPPMVRPMTGPTGQGYYAVQRMPPQPAEVYRDQQVQRMPSQPVEVYRDQQVQRMPSQPADVYRDQQVYNVVSTVPPQAAVPSMGAAPPTLPQQKVTGYSEGYGMVRSTTTGGGAGAGGGAGLLTDAGYTQLAYDGVGRQVMYTAGTGGVMGGPPQVQQAQFPAMTAAAELRSTGSVESGSSRG